MFPKNNPWTKIFSLLWCSYLELCSWQCWLKLCNWLIKKNVPKDCSCFQTMTYLHDSATFWCIHASVVIMLNLYKDGYTCIYMCICVFLRYTYGIHVNERKSIKLKEFQHSALFLLCTPKNNIFGIIDIGAHKPWWLHVPFARFYVFHV